MTYDGNLISIRRSVFGYGQNRRSGYKIFLNREPQKLKVEEFEVEEFEKAVLELIEHLLEAEG